jgi:hypothetical protein
MTSRFDPRTAAAANDALDAWDAEGGAAARADGPTATLRSRAERRLLERLGAALLEQWHGLPTPLRRAIYDRAVAGAAPGDASALRRSMARLLHDHQDNARRDAGA